MHKGKTKYLYAQDITNIPYILYKHSLPINITPIYTTIAAITLLWAIAAMVIPTFCSFLYYFFNMEDLIM